MGREDDGDTKVYTYRSKKDMKLFTGKIKIVNKQDFPAGSEMADKGLLEVKNGLLNGEVIAFYPPASTARKYREHYKDGLLDGECIYYNIPGAVEARRIYKNGRLMEEKTYDTESRKLSIHLIYSETDKRAYREIDYYPNGKVKSDHHLKDFGGMLKHGRCIDYDETGRIVEDAVYHRGKIKKQ